MKKLVLLIILLPLFTFAQTEAELMYKKGVDTTQYIPVGLSVGSKAPVIKGVSFNQDTINSTKILKEKSIVLIFYRGKWCPYCNRFLSNLNDSLEYLASKQVEIIVVGPESIENTEKTADKSEANFVILSDTTLQIQKDYDVLFQVTKKYQGKIKTFLLTDIAKNNAQEKAALPVPATYIINKAGEITWRYFDYDYSKRPSVKEILDHLE